MGLTQWLFGWLEIADGIILGLVPFYEQETFQLIDVVEGFSVE